MSDGVGRILVVDDNPGDARLVSYALAHEPGGEIESARADRVAAAIEKLRGERFAAVLLDLGLPDSRGADGVERIRASAPEVAVVVLSGAEDPEGVRRAFAAGAQDYLVKGIFPAGRLTATLRRAIERQRLEGFLAGGTTGVDAFLASAEAIGESAAVVPPDGPARATARFRAEALGRPVSDAELGAWVGAAVRGPGGSPAPEVDRAGTVLHSVAGPGGPLLLVWGRPSAEDPLETPLPASTDPLDATTWRQLEELGGADRSFLPALVAAFLEEAPRLERATEAAADRGDAEAVAHGAHTLKSACAQVGALGLARRWSALEAMAERGDAGSWPATVRSIREEARAVESALRARVAAR